MITKAELIEIYSIVDKFGGEEKSELRKRLIKLLTGKETRIKNTIINRIKKA